MKSLTHEEYEALGPPWPKPGSWEVANRLVSRGLLVTDAWDPKAHYLTPLGELALRVYEAYQAAKEIA